MRKSRSRENPKNAFRKKTDKKPKNTVFKLRYIRTTFDCEVVGDPPTPTHSVRVDKATSEIPLSAQNGNMKT